MRIGHATDHPNNRATPDEPQPRARPPRARKTSRAQHDKNRRAVLHSFGDDYDTSISTARTIALALNLPTVNVAHYLTALETGGFVRRTPGHGARGEASLIRWTLVSKNPSRDRRVSDILLARNRAAPWWAREPAFGLHQREKWTRHDASICELS